MYSNKLAAIANSLTMDDFVAVAAMFYIKEGMSYGAGRAHACDYSEQVLDETADQIRNMRGGNFDVLYKDVKHIIKNPMSVLVLNVDELETIREALIAENNADHAALRDDPESFDASDRKDVRRTIKLRDTVLSNLL